MNIRVFEQASAYRFSAWIVSSVQCVFASIFIGLCSQISIPLPFTPVPLALQSLAVILVGACLGSKKGCVSVLMYLIQGSLGAPVWASGTSGLLKLFGPTGGYLMAYPLEVYLIGTFVEKKSRNELRLFFCFLIPVSLQLGIGSFWLATFVGIKNCLSLGFYPFILVEIFKILMVLSYQKISKKI